MKKDIPSQKFLKQRRFFLMLPLLVLPFVVVLFVSLGGGKSNTMGIAPGSSAHGLNANLPEAHFKKNREKDKMGLYEERSEHEAKRLSQIKNDPYYKTAFEGNQEYLLDSPRTLQSLMQDYSRRDDEKRTGSLKSPDHLFSRPTLEASEKKVVEKFAQLTTELNKKDSREEPADVRYPDHSNADIEKLQQLMAGMQKKNPGEVDPDLEKINGMLDKIMNIQHPEKNVDSSVAFNRKYKTALPVSLTANLALGKSASHFFDMGPAADTDSAGSKSIEAMVDQQQQLVNGTRIRLRLLQNIYVKGLVIPRDQWVYGTGLFSDERFKITINSVNCGDRALPVSLEVYDLDGLQGVYVPGSISRESSKQSADEAVTTLGINSFDPSVGAQAVNAGFQAAKTLMSKKIKLVRGTIHPAYRVLLKDMTQK